VRHVPTNAAQQEDVRKASAIFMQAGRPDLDAEFRTMMAQVNQVMRNTKVFAVYRQQDVPMEELLPLSITASLLTAAHGENLDGWGAVFLDDHVKHIVRWVTEAKRPSGASSIDGVGGRTITYVVPVPGTQRRKALVFTSTIVIPDGDVLPAEVLDELALLSDSIVSTFAWERVAEEDAVPAVSPAEAG
jgi:hypothetical protein